MRTLAPLMLLAACAPTGQVERPSPVPEPGPVLRDLGALGSLGTWRIRVGLPSPGFMLVLMAQGNERLEPVVLSIAPDQRLPAGQHVAVALGTHVSSGVVGCANPVLWLQAAFPSAAGSLPFASLTDPAMPASAGPAAVLIDDPTRAGCHARGAPAARELYLLVSARPFESAEVSAALRTIPPRTPRARAARLLAETLGATLHQPPGRNRGAAASPGI